jgi:DNA-binding response OmpR family regulator
VSRILVVEDDRDIGELIRRYLTRAGHPTELLTTGSDVLPALRARHPDLLILDLMLPGMHGLDICRAVRADPAFAALPIIMVTARAQESDRVGGLELGADDYVTKPFSPKELVARVGALLRRTTRATAEGGLLRYGPLEIDRVRHVVTDEGREVSLTAKEFLLLEYLVEHKDRVLSRDLLLTDVWGYQYTGGTRTVDVHVRRLREKLPILATSLVTVKQFGYRLEAQPTTVARKE